MKRKIVHTRGFLFLLMATVLFKSSFGQSRDSLSDDYFSVIDSMSIDKLHRLNKPLSLLNLGNLGTKELNLIDDALPRLQFHNSWFIDSRLAALKRDYYDTKRPYSSVAYSMGANEEEYLNVFHSQSIDSRGNFTFGLDKTRSKGNYRNQATNNNHLYASFWRVSKRDIYKVNVFFDYQRLKLQENGGILKADSLFEHDSLFNRARELNPVNLSHAFAKIDAKSLLLNQEFKVWGQTDSLSLGNQLRFLINSQYKTGQRIYYDTLFDPTFYSQLERDSSGTRDTLFYRVFNVSPGIKFVVRNSKVLLASTVFYDWQSGTFDYFDSLTSQSSLATSALGYRARIGLEGVRINGEYKYFLSGYRAKDREVKINIKGKFGSSFGLLLDAKILKVSPGVDMLTNRGNHTTWNNDFKQSENILVNTRANFRKSIFLSWSYAQSYRPIFFDWFGRPVQYDGFSQVISTSIRSELEFGRFKFEPKFVHQYIGALQIIQLPQYYGDMTISYGFSGFKKHLHLRLGFDVKYFSNFNLYDYRPESGFFAISQDKTFGNYPILDLFFNGRIKTVRFFASLAHANGGLMGYTYYGALNYPLRDRIFRFGFSWGFVN